MLALCLTLVVLAAWHLVVSRLDAGSLSTRLCLTGIGASGQIVLTCLAHGLLGTLTRGWVAATTLVIAAGLVALAWRLGGSPPDPAALILGDLRTLARRAREALGWETAILACLLIFAALWIGTAIRVYPPRGVDDLVYHLPPVYKAVQDHRLSLLPIELRNLFAFPMAGEMTFLWVALLTGEVRWVDSVQALFAVFGCLAVYALGRRFALSPRGALLAAGLFVLTPVVLLQAPSNYIDLITNAWILAAAVSLLRFEETGSRLALALGGAATGLVLGSKYQTLFIVLALAVLAWFGLLRQVERAWRRAAGLLLFGAAALPGFAYWYLRNWIVFANPFFPLPVRLFGVTIFAGPWEQGSSIWKYLLSDPAELFRIAVWDPGLGTYNGGFGFLFWGFAVPGVLYLAWSVFQDRGSARAGRLSTLALFPVAFGSLLLTPHADLRLTPRYVLCACGIAFIGFAHLVERSAVRRAGVATALRAAGGLAALLSLSAASPATQPLVTLRFYAEDPPAARVLTEQRFIRDCFSTIRGMWAAWAPLDAITCGGRGLSVYESATWGVFWTGPTFGSELQNRVWNFETRPSSDPDAFFYHYLKKEAYYVGKPIPRETVAADPRYRLVGSGGDASTALYVSRAALAERGREESLLDFYRRLYPALVRSTVRSAQAFEPGGVALIPFPFAAAYAVHRAEGIMKAEVEPVTIEDLALVASRETGRVVYSWDAPVPGRAHRSVQTLTLDGRTLTIYRNEPLAVPVEGSGSGTPEPGREGSGGRGAGEQGGERPPGGAAGGRP